MVLGKEKSGGRAKLGDGFGITFGSQGNELPNAGSVAPYPTALCGPASFMPLSYPAAVALSPAGPRSLLEDQGGHL